ncbi:SET [Glarea lozoyensis ATCC 20868]|uniref:SET n=1 Tax=Glarea lozoyensis (strain ATCC 20868 / MF5171) TaxID=1116229 RepID=S3DIA6_GLAL2|nr:SET [Glarea lozoyensis ATCC 20868]EPE36879.1 SET [Glarea lozoyensis ATCC 20868]
MAGSRSDSMVSGKESDKIPLTRADGLVLVLDTPKGRGVFANKDIPGRSVIEVCPVLVLDPVENEEYIRKTELYHYTYNWPYTPPKKQENNMQPNQNGISKIPTMTQAVILGLGSMFNHSVPNQNVGWERDVARQLMTYTALRDIQKGEELCISYGQRLTFKDTEEPVHQDSDDWTEVMNYIDFIG